MSGERNKLIELTEKKEQEIIKLLEKTREQQKAIIDDDIDRLHAITDLKQDIINYIESINEEFKKSYKKVEENLDLDEIKDFLEEKTKHIIHITDVIKNLESDNQQQLKEKMKVVKGHINSLKKSRRGMNAYFQNMPESVYIDQKN